MKRKQKVKKENVAKDFCINRMQFKDLNFFFSSFIYIVIFRYSEAIDS